MRKQTLILTTLLILLSSFVFAVDATNDQCKAQCAKYGCKEGIISGPTSAGCYSYPNNPINLDLCCKCKTLSASPNWFGISDLKYLYPENTCGDPAKQIQVCDTKCKNLGCSKGYGEISNCQCFTSANWVVHSYISSPCKVQDSFCNTRCESLCPGDSHGKTENNICRCYINKGPNNWDTRNYLDALNNKDDFCKKTNSVSPTLTSSAYCIKDKNCIAKIINGIYSTHCTTMCNNQEACECDANHNCQCKPTSNNPSTLGNFCKGTEIYKRIVNPNFNQPPIEEFVKDCVDTDLICVNGACIGDPTTPEIEITCTDSKTLSIAMPTSSGGTDTKTEKCPSGKECPVGDVGTKPLMKLVDSTSLNFNYGFYKEDILGFCSTNSATGTTGIKGTNAPNSFCGKTRSTEYYSCKIQSEYTGDWNKCLSWTSYVPKEQQDEGSNAWATYGCAPNAAKCCPPSNSATTGVCCVKKGTDNKVTDAKWEEGKTECSDSGFTKHDATEDGCDKDKINAAKTQTTGQKCCCKDVEGKKICDKDPDGDDCGSDGYYYNDECRGKTIMTEDQCNQACGSCKSNFIKGVSICKCYYEQGKDPVFYTRDLVKANCLGEGSWSRCDKQCNNHPNLLPKCVTSDRSNCCVEQTDKICNSKYLCIPTLPGVEMPNMDDDCVSNKNIGYFFADIVLRKWLGQEWVKPKALTDFANSINSAINPDSWKQSICNPQMEGVLGVNFNEDSGKGGIYDEEGKVIGWVGGEKSSFNKTDSYYIVNWMISGTDTQNTYRLTIAENRGSEKIQVTPFDEETGDPVWFTLDPGETHQGKDAAVGFLSSLNLNWICIEFSQPYKMSSDKDGRKEYCRSIPTESYTSADGQSPNFQSTSSRDSGSSSSSTTKTYKPGSSGVNCRLTGSC